MTVILVITHGLLAMTLAGAITHQGLSVWRTPAPARLFIDRFRAVPGPGYANAVVALYLITFIFGAYIYPTYVLDVKGFLVKIGKRTTLGVFQIKEHVTVLGLALLPVYWYFWKRAPLTENLMARRVLTTMLLAVVWWSLLVGRLLNNLRGLQ